MSEVTIVGAGPVGLLLALRLHDLGVRASVIERRSGPHEGSRSIGIHPPLLERLDELGVGERFVERGVRVRRGRAFAGRSPLGSVDFASCAGRHPYVLTLEQRETEGILRDALEERAPGALREGLSVIDLEEGEGAIVLALRDERGSELREQHALVAACDGRWSACRESLGVSFRGAAYPGSYVMGDAPETTSFGEDAAIFLHEEGIVESFPLPGGARRWVAHRPRECEAEEPEEALASAIAERTGQRVRRDAIERCSTFVAEHFVADRLVVGRVALAGDAAHVVSPIGGQGMNLGWMGAWSLAGALAASVLAGEPTRALEADARRRRRIARAARRRAELNMWLGRPSARGARDLLVRALLARPIVDGLARLFTMRGLAWGI